MAFDMTKEEDVKEYLDKLGVEYRFGCFGEKNPDACHRLGQYMETVKNDFDKALKVHKNNCDEYNYGKSCFQYAFLGLRGKGPKHIRDEVPAYFKKGCDAGCSDACTTGGMLLLSKKDGGNNAQTALLEYNRTREDQMAELDLKKKPAVLLAQDPAEVKRGIEFLRKGCDLDNATACYYLSTVFIKGRQDCEVLPDFTQAFKHSQKACRLGHPIACGNLAMMYQRGDGVPKDLMKADLYKSMALDMTGQGHRTIEFQRGT